MNLAIFRAYDIRGKQHEITPKLAGIIAHQLIAIYDVLHNSEVNPKKLIIGTDCRPYSSEIAGPIVSAFSEAGWQIELQSKTITPVIYYLDYKKQSNIAFYRAKCQSIDRLYKVYALSCVKPHNLLSFLALGSHYFLVKNH